MNSRGRMSGTSRVLSAGNSGTEHATLPMDAPARGRSCRTRFHPSFALLATACAMLVAGGTAQGLTAPSGWASWFRFISHYPCPIAEDPAAAVQQALASRVVAQDAATKVIVDAVADWARKLRAGKAAPLVLFVTGPTGVGKTETAHTLASAILRSRVTVAGGSEMPEGFVVLLGQNYADASRGGLAGLQEEVRHAVAQELYRCRGQAVVLFDEAQKAVHAVLDVLSPIMEPTNAHLAYRASPKDAAPFMLNATRTILIVVSDVGLSDLQRYMREASAETSDPALLASLLERRLRAQLSTEWKGAFGGLDLGARATAIVPFLPFSHRGAMLVLEQHLRNIGADPTYERVWDELRWEPELVTLLAEPKYTDYNAETCPRDRQRGKKAAASSPAAPGAARVNADGSADVDTRPLLCGVPRAMDACVFVNHGARSLFVHNRSPINRLQRLLDRVLQAAGLLYNVNATTTTLSARFITRAAAEHNKSAAAELAEHPPPTVAVHIDVVCPSSSTDGGTGSAGSQSRLVVDDIKLRLRRCVARKKCTVLYEGGLGDD